MHKTLLNDGLTYVKYTSQPSIFFDVVGAMHLPIHCLCHNPSLLQTALWLPMQTVQCWLLKAHGTAAEQQKYT